MKRWYRPRQDWRRPMKTLKKVQFQDCPQIQTRAGKEGISVRDAKDAIWFHFTDRDEILGICALLPLRDNGGRLKAVWIKPEHRKQGNGAEVIEQLMEFARNAGADRLAVIAYNPKFYEARGFKKLGDPRPNKA